MRLNSCFLFKARFTYINNLLLSSTLVRHWRFHSSRERLFPDVRIAYVGMDIFFERISICSALLGLMGHYLFADKVALPFHRFVKSIHF